MKKTKGFTLVEVLIAIIVIAIIAVAAFEFFRYCQRFILQAELKLMAVNLAREKMEELYWDSDPPEPPAVPEDIMLTTSHSFERNYTIGDSTGNYKIIDVTISWGD